MWLLHIEAHHGPGGTCEALSQPVPHGRKLREKLLLGAQECPWLGQGVLWALSLLCVD